jgi:uncharacterized delta-60 repeat protein
MNPFSITSLHITKAIKRAFKNLKVSRHLFVWALAVLLINIPSSHQVEAAAGDLDITFGTGGKIISEPGAGEAMVIQPDGKIVVVGSGYSATASGNFLLLRYNINGTLDAAFGVGGKVLTEFNSHASASVVALQPDGKIVVAGTSYFISQNFILVRYNPDGSIDSGFGNNGKVTTDFFGFDDMAYTIAIRSNGKIVVAGSAGRNRQFPPISDFALAQYNSDGTPDLTFGNGGKTVTDFRGTIDVAYSLLIQPDGKAVLAGSSAFSISFPILDFALARYNSDGSPDTGFGNNGLVITDFFGAYDEAYALALQTDGKIVAAGFATNPRAASETDFALVRYLPNGSLDSSFGAAGKTVTDFSSAYESIHDIVIQPNGKIVVAGIKEIDRSPSPKTDWALARYSQTGILDPTFGSGGKISTTLSSDSEYARAMALQNDGKIVVAGFANFPTPDGQSEIKVALARYNGDTNFDVCLQDDNSGNLLQVNSLTGEYQFSNCTGLTLGGIGTVTKRGCTITLQHNAADRRINAKLDSCQNKGTASVQLFSTGAIFSITDKNTANNTCTCP